MQLARTRGGVRALLMTAGLWAGACDPAPVPIMARPSAIADAPSRAASPTVRSPIGFRSARLFDEHFAKHGREFGDISQPEYLRRAQALRDAPVGNDVLEVVRSDGVISRFDRASGAFIAFDRNGTIRTFFRPNDGAAYFYRQAKRRPERR